MRSGLDRVHILVRESEMVANFVYQDMLDQVIEPLITSLHPFCQDGQAVEKDAIREGLGPAD